MLGSVLVVEDDPDILELYRLLLTRKNLRVWGAVRTGEEAVDLYSSAKDPPDVVLLDHRLPGCTGLDAAGQILRSDPLASFVLVSADESAIRKARADGIESAKRKPISNAELIDTLMRAIDEARDRRKAAQ